MKFWDSSALVPLLVEERRSASCRSLRHLDRGIVVWALTRTELVSATHRLVRDGMLLRADVTAVQRRLDALSRSWAEIDGVDVVRDRAERLLAIHSLTAADALQLGAALVHVRDRPRGRGFVTADERLGAAAGAEGFDVLVPRAA